MAYTLPPLPYPANALEPFIDAQTMEIHHGKHHQAYVTNANKALEGSEFADLHPIEMIARLSELPERLRIPVRNNAGGHVNHTMFWSLMAPQGQGGGGQPTGALGKAIVDTWGSFDGFKEKFAAIATGRFGSGWAWLVARPGGPNSKLDLVSTANQDNPLMGTDFAGVDGQPILGLDVWEHAYYLKYQNKRPDYITAWWNVVNWAEANRNYEKAMEAR